MSKGTNIIRHHLDEDGDTVNISRQELVEVLAEIDRLWDALICARNQAEFLDFPRYARDLIDRALSSAEHTRK